MEQGSYIDVAAKSENTELHGALFYERSRRALMSKNVEPSDDFNLNVQRQAEAKEQQDVTKGSTALKVEHEHGQSLERQNRVVSARSSWSIIRLLRTAFEVLLRAWVMFLSILWTIKSGIGGLLSLFLAHLIDFALAHPMLKTWALALLFRFPALEAWLCKFAMARGIIFSCATVQISSDVHYEPSTKFSRLTPSARSIYADLKAAIERQNKEG